MPFMRRGGSMPAEPFVNIVILFMKRGDKTPATRSLRDEARGIVAAEQRASKKGATLSFNAKLLIAVTIICFGVLHAVADGALRHKPAPQPAEDRMPLPDRD
jgi:hypothetical protein